MFKRKISVLLFAFMSTSTFGICYSASAESVANKSDCKNLLESQIPTFEEFENRILILLNPAGQMRAQKSLTRQTLSLFWKQTWPDLQSMAEDSETSVDEILGEYIALFEIGVETILEPQGKFYRETQLNFQMTLRSAATLSKLNVDQALKGKNLGRIESIYRLLQRLSYFAVLIEKGHLPKPSFNPFRPLDREQLKAILRSLDNSSLDRISAQAWQPSQEISMKNDGATIDLPVTETQISNLKAEEVNTDPVVHPNLNSSRLAEEKQLARVLRDGVPLRANFIYQMSTVRGELLSVELTEELIKESQGPTLEVVTRLLKSMVTGRGDKSGLKTLYSVGPGIIELKGIFHGHKRIIGCLKGRSVVLKKLIDIKETRAAYARRIPANFCVN